MNYANLILALSLLIFACDRDEDVLPTPTTPAAAQQHSAITATEAPPKKHDTTNFTTASVINTEIYHFKKYQDLPYRILYPRNYDSTKTYPLVLFLHGIGESGDDNEKQLRWGADLFQADSIRDKYPAFVVFPQCPTTQRWYYEWGIETLTGLMNSLKSLKTVDNSRISIAGLSMGAYGTFAMVAHNPQLFRSAVAIAGSGDLSKVSSMLKTRWRVFAGRKDEIVASTKTEAIVDALKKSGASVSFKLYPQADHAESWINAFKEPDFCQWILGNP